MTEPTPRTLRRAVATLAVTASVWVGVAGPIGASADRTASPATAAAPSAAAQTEGWTDPTDQAAVLAAWRTIQAPSPDIGFTGDAGACRPGTTAAAYRQAQLSTTNAMRALSGVAPAVEDPAWSQQAQAAALMMSAEGRLSHATDPSWACWTQAAADGAATSNLYLHRSGAEASVGYVRDPGASNAVVGHRRWMLCPSVETIGFGDVPAVGSRASANATKVMPDGALDLQWPATRDGYVAWPNRGIVPLGLAESRGLLERFSITLPFGHSTAQAKVSVTSSSGEAVGVTELVRNDDSYCSPAVVWRPTRRPTVGESWTITVSDLLRSDGSTKYVRQWTTSFADLEPAASPHTPFVQAAYSDFLGRTPTADELAAETALLDQGTGRSAVLDRLAGSEEWIAGIVTGFYEDTLGRRPDAGGLAFWRGRLTTGGWSVAQVAANFYASPEYYGDLGSDAAWVDDLYAKLLGRTPDAGGRAYWTDQIARRGRPSVAYRLYQSAESRRDRVRALYGTLLQRVPDRAGLEHWAGVIERQGDIALARTLAASDEYARRAAARFPTD